MLLDIFSSVIETIGSWSEAIGLGWTVVAGLGLVLLTVIISFIATQFSIEVKTIRAVNKLNKYLELNPFVNNENLVEFNKLMKKIPAPMRRQWQQYMVTRAKKPSEFFTDANCIDNPFKSSNYESHITAVKASVIVIAIVSFIFNASYFVSGATDTQFSFTNLISSVLLSSVSLVIGEIYVMFLKARRNSCISDVYANFITFQKHIDKAVTTLPEYIDYEIMFTRKEISAGIPVLQEYLEQRAVYEEEQIKRSKETQVVHEKYDFSSLGINGSLVMEKSMHVSEQFIANKNNIRTYIIELESQKDLLEKNYDEKVKGTQRKLRDIQETLDRLKEKLDSTTNIIVGNDLRKQRENEIQKQRQIEKEAQEDSKKFEEEVAKIDEQISAKKAEIEEDRKRAETSLNSEFKSYADKIYAELKEIVDKQSKDEIEGLNGQVAELQTGLEERDKVLVEKDALYDEAVAQIEQFAVQFEEQNGIIQEQESRLQELGGIDDANNKEIFAVKQELESRNLEIEKKDRQIANQKAYIEKLKKKRHITGDELFVDADGRMYYINTHGNSIYVDASQLNNQVAEEEYSSEEYIEPIEEPAQEVESNLDLANEEIDSSLADKLNEEYGAEEPEEEKQEEINEYHKPVYDFQWENSNFQNPNQVAETKVAEESAQQPVELKEEEQPVESNEPVEEEQPTEAVEESLVKESVEETPVDETKEKKKKRFSLFGLFRKKKKEQVVEEPAEEPVSESVEEYPYEEAPESAEPEAVEVSADELFAEEKVEDAKIDEIDKMIVEQNAELEKQNQQLSRQLEDTQKVAKEKPAKKKVSAKKSTAKKPTKKAEIKKPSAKKSAKKPVKKAEAKKPVKKAEAKKPVKKAEFKKTTAKKPTKKTESKKSVAKKPQVKKAEKVKKINDKTPLGELNLAQFNEQLKNMLKNIDNGGDKK